LLRGNRGRGAAGFSGGIAVLVFSAAPPLAAALGY
jgi:hypothetical protein